MNVECTTPWPTRGRPRRSLTLSLILVAGLGLSTDVDLAPAQPVCFAPLDPVILTPPDLGSGYFVGSTVTVDISVTVLYVINGTQISIPSIEYALDCFDNGFLALCTDAGARISYDGDAALTTNCTYFDDTGMSHPVAVSSTNPTGGPDPNILSFVFAPEVELPPTGVCHITFDVTIVDVPAADMTPSLIESATEFIGSCDNGLSGQSNATLAIEVLFCGDDTINMPDETCDGTAAAGCNANGCRPPGVLDACTCCGDGVLQEGAGELCDTAAANSDDPDALCRPDCLPQRCGDGIIDPGAGETCEPPGKSQPSGNPCRADCTFCGDGIVQAPEQCDGGPECTSGCMEIVLVNCCLPDGRCVPGMPAEQCASRGGQEVATCFDDACDPPLVAPALTPWGMVVLLVVLLAAVAWKGGAL